MAHVDLIARLQPIGRGWRATMMILAKSDFVDDVTRPGRFISGPAIVQLTEAPSGSLRLFVEPYADDAK